MPNLRTHLSPEELDTKVDSTPLLVIADHEATGDFTSPQPDDDDDDFDPDSDNESEDFEDSFGRDDYGPYDYWYYDPYDYSYPDDEPDPSYEETTWGFAHPALPQWELDEQVAQCWSQRLGDDDDPHHDARCYERMGIEVITDFDWNRDDSALYDMPPKAPVPLIIPDPFVVERSDHLARKRLASKRRKDRATRRRRRINIAAVVKTRDDFPYPIFEKEVIDGQEVVTERPAPPRWRFYSRALTHNPVADFQQQLERIDRIRLCEELEEADRELVEIAEEGAPEEEDFSDLMDFWWGDELG